MNRVARVRDGVLIAAVTLSVWLPTPSQAGDPPAVGLIKRLVDPRFEVRSEAQRDLTNLKSVDIEQLAEAATKNAEHAARIVAVLERLFVGTSMSPSPGNVARSALISSADALLSIRRIGEFNETDITRAAEAALERLADGESAAAPLAQAVLARHAVLSENRSIEALRRLGAKVVFSTDKDQLHATMSELAEAALDGEPEEEVTIPAPHIVSHVYILRKWTGGKTGLEYLRKLRVDGALQVYLVDGCGITAADMVPLKATIPGLSPTERSAATLGVQSSIYQIGTEGCEISRVQEGLAADKAGLRGSFTILSVDGDPIKKFDGTPDSLVQRLRSCHPGDVVTLKITRVPNADPEEVKVALSDWADVPDIMNLGSH